MKKLLSLFCLVLCLLAASLPAAASPRRVVMVILDKITLADLVQPGLPNLAWAMRHGGIALMNTKTGGTLAAEHAYITLGAGSRGVGTPDSGSAYAAGDPLEGGTAAQVLRRNTGCLARPGNLVLPGVAGVMALNAVQDHPVSPGLLGRLLHEAGLSTCALGNGDAPNLPGRQVVSLVMDERGLVDTGAVGRELLRADRSWPFGYRTDYEALLASFRGLAGRAALCAVDLGDTTRIDAYALNLDPARQAALRHRAIQEADRFIGRLRLLLGEDTLLLIVSPSPSTQAQESGNPMTPLIAIGPGFAPGWLSSATTRRPGIVTNMDVAPTVLSFLGLEIPPEADGRPLLNVSGRGGLPELLRQDARITAAALWQKPVLRFYTIFVDVVFVLGALFLLWPGLPGARWLQAALLAAAGFPLVLLLAPLRQESIHFLPWLAGLTIALTGLLMALPRRRLLPLFLLFGGTVAVIALDQLRGASLAHYSLLSYSPIAGSRFYGIGNEYMGVLLGAAAISAGFACSRWHGRRWLFPLVCLVFLSLAVVLGAPSLGTNAGGVVAAILCFGPACLLLTGRKCMPRSLLIIAAAALGTIFLLFVADSLRAPAVQTHLGRLLNMVRQEGLQPFWQMIQRKLAMNFKLVRFSGWSRVAVFALLAMLVTALIPAGRGRALTGRYPYVARAIWASLAGAAAAFLLNDSGVVAAGTLLVYPAVAWLFLLSGEEGENAVKE